MTRRDRRIVLGVATLACLLAASPSHAEEPAPLVLEAKIPLGAVSGRIDHLAIDPPRQRLFVAELGNDSVGVVDLKTGKVAHRITGLKEPQGVGYVEASDRLYVANAGDGSVRVFAGPDLAPAGTIALGNDADNIRVDLRHNRVWVGYGGGALAALDAATGAKTLTIPLKEHPEGFQLDAAGETIFANVPDAHQIVIIPIASGKPSATIAPPARANFPMALDPAARRVLAVFRSPPALMAFDAANGELLARIETCGDADDVFVDGKRDRVYVSCGAGMIDVFARAGASYRRLARLDSQSGARTALFVPALDHLYLAVRSVWTAPAAIWVYRPMP